MNTFDHSQLSSLQRYQMRSDRRMKNLIDQRDKQRKKERINNLIFLGLGIVFAAGFLYMLIQHGNIVGDGTDFSMSFSRLLHR